eukprot:gene24552-18498_t
MAAGAAAVMQLLRAAGAIAGEHAVDAGHAHDEGRGGVVGVGSGGGMVVAAAATVGELRRA